VTGCPLLLCQEPIDSPAEICSPRHLITSVIVNGYLFRTYRGGDDDTDNCLQVIRDGKVIFRRTLNSHPMFQGYALGQSASRKWKIPSIPNGTDITGRGHPDMIVSLYTGGAHCCLMHYVFELEPSFRLLATLNARDTWPAYFADLDGNHHYFYLAEDWTFAYWWGSFAGSPNHSVVLQYVDDAKGGGFHLAIEKMKTPAPTSEEWGASLRSVREELALDRANMANSLPNVLWNEVMGLIYTDHSDLAWKFLDEIGPEAQAGDKPDLAAFCSTLKTSPYWADLEPTLRNTPPACANAKPGRR